MRWLFLLFLVGITVQSTAQQTDSLARSRENPSVETGSPSQDKKESFGDYVQKVGLGIWGRVKERFNLEGVVESLEEKKNKFLVEKDKKTNDAKEKKQPPEKEEKRELSNE